MDIDLLIIGSGFRYENEAQELLALKRGKHTTTTADMLAVRTHANVTRGVASTAELISVLLEIFSKPENTLKSLSIMGHSDNLAIDFTGRLDPEEQGAFSTGESMDASILRGKIRPRIEQFRRETGRDPFSPNAVITLYGCHSGQPRTKSQLLYAPGDLLLQATADTFGRTAFGFTKPLRECVRLSQKRDKIIGRGWFQVTARPQPGGIVERRQACLGFTNQLEDLIPDVSRDPS